MRSDEIRIKSYTGWLQEWAKRISGKYEVVHKYFGDTLPYRWEISRDEPPEWVGTIQLEASEIAILYSLPEEDERRFLHSKLAAILRNIGVEISQFEKS